MGKNLWWYLVVLSQRFGNIIAGQLTNKLNLKCYVLYQTKELLTITKMHITIVIILMFITSITLAIIIMIFLLLLLLLLLLLFTA